VHMLPRIRLWERIIITATHSAGATFNIQLLPRITLWDRIIMITIASYSPVTKSLQLRLIPKNRLLEMIILIAIDLSAVKVDDQHNYDYFKESS
jgi:hypothetical protein